MTQAAAPQQPQRKSVAELERDICLLRHALCLSHSMLSREMPAITCVLCGTKSRTELAPVFDNLSSVLRIIEGAL